MNRQPSQQGTIPFHIPRLPSHSCYTSYKIFGSLSPTSPPLIILHGGPGAGHEYLLPFAELWWQCNIPVIFYDQIGCAASTHLPQTSGDQAFWQEDLFIAELDNLVDYFQLRVLQSVSEDTSTSTSASSATAASASVSGFHILGHSWGGRLAAAYAARRPSGLRRSILASGIASTELAQQGRRLQIDKLPADSKKAIHEVEEEGGDPATEAYQNAVAVFSRMFLCRSDPFPPDELKPALRHRAEDRTVFETMMGPSPFKITGSLTGWTCIPRLPNINVKTLIYNAQYDTSHDVATAPFFELIPDSRWITFADAGHMCHIEGDELREKVLKTVGEFLTQDQEEEWHIHCVV